MIEIKCSNCGQEFDITRSKCPFCGDPVKTSCKFYCGDCESKLEFGDFNCKKCGKYPNEIIIEQKNGEKIKTNFDPPKGDIEKRYINHMHGKYIVFPNIIYWFIPLTFALVLLLTLPSDNSCTSDFMCFEFSFFNKLFISFSFIILWIFITFPILLYIYHLRDKYHDKINFDLIKREKSTLLVECKHCGESINISRGMVNCPKCGKRVCDSYKLHCGDCQYYMEPGEVICSHCFNVPKEIIVETPDKKRVKTTFDSK